jgi:predicted outer membrane repeat protein
MSGARAGNSVGGAVAMDDVGTLILDSVVFDDNQAAGGQGGAVFFDRGFTSIRNSTFTHDEADFGGAIMGSQFGADVGNGEIINSTLEGNEANDFGGAVYTNVSHIQILSSTIVGNVGGADDSGGGGGTYNGSDDALDFSVANTLYSGNKVGASSPVDDQCGGDHTSFGYNLRETSEAGCTGLIQTGDTVDSSASMLGSLGSNGGPTPTIALLAGNFAIDHGNDALAIGAAFPACPATDQRGFLRGGTAGRCDIGAFELNAAPPSAGGTTMPPASSGPTGQRAAAIRKCKRKFPKGPRRKKCIKKARKRFPA